MNFSNNRVVKAVGIIIVIGIIFLVLFIFMSVFLPNQFEIMMKKTGLFNVDPFYTSAEYRQKLGVEIINTPVANEENLHSMIKKVYENGLNYFKTGNDENLKKTESYFLPEEYNELKQNIENGRKECQYKKVNRDSSLQCEEVSGFQLSETKFSVLRKYKDLPGRLGIIAIAPVNSVNHVSPPELGLGYNIFIFKQKDNEWKIEKIHPLGGGYPPTEIGEGTIINELTKNKNGL